MANKKTTTTRKNTAYITLRTFINTLRREAAFKNVPAELVNESIEKTIHAVELTSRVDPAASARGRAYFWAIIRKRSMRRDGDEYLRGMFLLTSVVEDLRSSGVSDKSILVELENCWASRVPADVMAEFRSKLASVKMAV